jgi:hypothetical protein
LRDQAISFASAIANVNATTLAIMLISSGTATKGGASRKYMRSDWNNHHGEISLSHQGHPANVTPLSLAQREPLESPPEFKRMRSPQERPLGINPKSLHLVNFAKAVKSGRKTSGCNATTSTQVCTFTRAVS